VSTVESDTGTQRRFETIEARLELLVVILLGLAATATAWASFQSSQHDGEMMAAFARANLNLNAANASYNEGLQVYLHDELVFLRYAEALYDNDIERAAYLRETVMSDDLEAAITWWEAEGADFDTPFVDENPYFVVDAYDQADVLRAATDTRFSEGQEANTVGGRYSLISVVLAAALFVLGISNSFSVTSVRVALISVGSVILIGSTIWMLTLPVVT